MILSKNLPPQREVFYFIFGLMNKPWVGYLSSGLLLFAAVLMFLGGRTGLAVLFALVAGASAVMNMYMYRKPRQ
jgi:hypothetical protein